MYSLLRVSLYVIKKTIIKVKSKKNTLVYVSYDANKQKLKFFRLGFVAGEYNIKVKEKSEQRVQIKRQEHLIYI